MIFTLLFNFTLIFNFVSRVQLPLFSSNVFYRNSLIVRVSYLFAPVPFYYPEADDSLQRYFHHYAEAEVIAYLAYNVCTECVLLLRNAISPT